MATPGRPAADEGRLPNLPIPADPDLALPDIYVPPPIDAPSWMNQPSRGRTRPQPPVGDRDQDRPLPTAVVALARSIPCALGAFVAAAAWLGTGFLPAGDLPVMLLLVVAVQAGGYAIAKINDLRPWARTFLANAAIVLAILPLLAVQASATRLPYVSTEFGTARPAIVATAAAVVALFALAVSAIATAWEAPENAALLFLPAALLVPAMLGTPLAVTEPRVALLVTEVFALSTIGTFLALVAPITARPVVGPVCLACYFGVLLLLDRGPTREPTSGEIARILDGSLVAVAAALTIIVPIVAFGIRRMMREVNVAERAMAFERIAKE